MAAATSVRCCGRSHRQRPHRRFQARIGWAGRRLTLPMVLHSPKPFLGSGVCYPAKNDGDTVVAKEGRAGHLQAARTKGVFAGTVERVDPVDDLPFDQVLGLRIADAVERIRISIETAARKNRGPYLPPSSFKIVPAVTSQRVPVAVHR